MDDVKKDSFLRNKAGQLHMGHLAAFITLIVAVAFSLTAIYGFIVQIQDWTVLANLSVPLFGICAGVEYGTNHLDRPPH